jgi:hypothetical protein
MLNDNILLNIIISFGSTPQHLFVECWNSLWLMSHAFTEVNISKYNAINSGYFVNPKFLTDGFHLKICFPYIGVYKYLEHSEVYLFICLYKKNKQKHRGQILKRFLFLF